MSSRPQFTPFPVIVNGNMASQIISAVTIVQKLSMISYACSWSGTAPAGAVSVQISNDYSQNGQGQVSNPGTWNTLPLGTNTTNVSDNTGNGFIDILQTGGYAMRLVYTPTSGVGTFNATVSAKVA